MLHLFIRFLVIPLAASFLALGAATVTLPLPEMAVPKTSKPPTIDGDLKPGEWDQAAACTGFVKAFDGALSRAQSTAWITYDDKYLYVAFRNYRSEQLAIISVSGRRSDDDAIVADPSNEIWISPATTPATTYQTVVNAYPAVLDVKMIPSLGFTSRSWSGRWEVASRQSAEGWTIEARAPIAAFGFDHIADGATWRALFATDVLADGTGFRAWAPGGAFADIARHGFLHFTAHGPAFQLLDVESLSSGRLNVPIAVSASDAGSAEVTVTMRFGTGAEPAAGDTVLAKTLSVAAGHREEYVFNSATNGYQRIPAAGFCTITAKSGSTILYHQVIPYTVDGYVRHPPARVLAKPYQDAFGLDASYAPLSKQLVVKIDRYYMPNRTSVAHGRVELRDTATGKAVAERPISPFWQDYSEFPLDLASLRVPIATDVLSPPPAVYQLQAVLSDHNGHDVATVTKPVKLEGYQFSWLPNDVGISDKVIPPWSPVRWDAATVSLWNKRYVMTGAGLAEKVTNSGIPQLTGPMRIEAVVNGALVTLAGASPTLIRQADAFVELKGTSKSGPLTVDARTRIEFDGFVWNTMTIQPTSANVGRLSLVVDMPESEAPSFVTTSGGWSSYFGSTPDKWDSRDSSLTSMVGNFVPYVFLTDSFRGFSWFADNTKGWRLDPALPTQELRRHDGLVTLRVNFINKAGPIDKALKVEYGWMVTPQKAQPRAWRAYLISGRKYFPQATPVF
ncbi:MAG TPA: glycoside hydrolase domain-containing protein, partial [Acidobacteriaceae bacterium]|nr:glycoside hydrolase domain-containing protein [Acidobacteriaceae bacterium]